MIISSNNSFKIDLKNSRHQWRKLLKLREKKHYMVLNLVVSPKTLQRLIMKIVTLSIKFIKSLTTNRKRDLLIFGRVL